MNPDLIFNGGIIICGVTAVCAVIAAIILRFLKARLNKQFDAEFGKHKRRH